MSKTAESLTEKLHNIADAKLKLEVDAAFDSIISQINNSENNIYSIHIDIGGKSTEINGWAAIEGIKKSIISGRTERVRDEAVKDFMRQVENLKTDIDELHQSIS